MQRKGWQWTSDRNVPTPPPVMTDKARTGSPAILGLLGKRKESLVERRERA